MRSVLYTHDLEPITIIDVNHWMLKHLDEHKCVVLPVQLQLPRVERYEDLIGQRIKFHIVRITAERHVWRNVESYMLFTEDEESALLLKAAFLPGQQSALNQRERDAMARGFLQAIQLFHP